MKQFCICLVEFNRTVSCFKQVIGSRSGGSALHCLHILHLIEHPVKVVFSIDYYIAGFREVKSHAKVVMHLASPYCHLTNFLELFLQGCNDVIHNLTVHMR